MSDDFMCVLETQNLNLYFSELIREIDFQDAYDLESFSVAKSKTQVLYKMLRYNSVTPGDFSRLAGKIRFMDEEDISAQMIVDELCAIQEEKDLDLDGRVGFAV